MDSEALTNSARLKLKIITRLLENYDWDWLISSGVDLLSEEVLEVEPPPETDRLKKLLLQFGGTNNRHQQAALLEVWRRVTDLPFNVGPLRVADQVKEGEWFAKTEGAYQYTRISDSSAKFFNMQIMSSDEDRSGGLDKYIFGMAPHGNLTDVKRDRIVWTRGEVTATKWTNRGWQKVEITGYDPFCGLPPNYQGV